MDPLAAVIDFLQSQTVITDLVGSRVFGGELPRSENAQMPRQAVVLTPAGGGLYGTETADWGDSRVDIDCYGASPLDAWELYLAVADALKGMQRQMQAGVLLHWAKPSSRGITARDPATDWPVTISSWQVLASGTP